MALSAEDVRLLARLQEHWGKLFRLTMLEQGMRALGQAPAHARRLRLGDALLADPSLHPSVERWGVRTVILAEDEKLLGRHLARLAEEGWGQVGLADAAAALDASAADVRRTLRTLAHLGLLSYRERDGLAAFTLSEGWPARLGPLGFAFLTEQRADGERFNVP